MGSAGRLPTSMRNLAESADCSAVEALNVPSLQTPQLLPFALSLVMQRLIAPWQIIRLAIRMAASDDEIRVAATPYGVAVTIALHDLFCLAVDLRTDIKRGHFDQCRRQSASRCMMACAACAPNSICAAIRRGAGSSPRSGPTFPTRCNRRSTACPAGSGASCVSAPTRILPPAPGSTPPRSTRPRP